jgi:hypothetical protein
VTSAPGATPIAAPAVGGVQFRCPPAGTRVNFETGFLQFDGADPADPAVCLATNSNGQQQRRLYNFWVLPLDDERAVRQGFAALWPAAPGRTASYTFIGRAADQNTFRYAERWRVLRTEALNIGGVSRNTVVLERTQEGMLGNTFLGTDTFWYDVDTGAFLKRNVTVTRGRAGGGPFEARSIVVSSPSR